MSKYLLFDLFIDNEGLCTQKPESLCESLPITAILHLHMLSATIFARAFGMNWQRIILSIDTESLVDQFIVTSRGILEDSR